MDCGKCYDCSFSETCPENTIYKKVWEAKAGEFYDKSHYNTIINESSYSFRIHRGSLYGEKIKYEKILKIIRERDNYPKKIQDTAYWLGRMEKNEKLIEGLASISPSCVILNAEIKNIGDNNKYHSDEINVIDTMIKKLEERKKHHWDAIKSNGDKVEKLEKEIVTQLDKDYEDLKIKCKAEYDGVKFITWAEKMGVKVKSPEKNADLYKVYTVTSPYVPPEKPSEKVVKKAKKEAGDMSPAKPTVTKKKKKPKGEAPVYGDEICGALKLYKNGDDWGGWCQ